MRHLISLTLLAVVLATAWLLPGLASVSGGTDVCTAFVGGVPLLPVYSGEIQKRGLGMAVDVYDEDGIPHVDMLRRRGAAQLVRGPSRALTRSRSVQRVARAWRTTFVMASCATRKAATR